MVNWRAVLAVLLRVVPAVVFIDVIRAGASAIMWLYPSGLGAIVASPRLIVVAASGVSAAVAVVFGSVFAYSVALVLLVLSGLPILQGVFPLPAYTSPTAVTSGASVGVPWLGIAGLFAVLILDTLATAYRPGAGPARPAVKRVVATTVTFLLIAAPFAAISLVVATYFSGLVGALRGVIASLASTSLYFVAGSLTISIVLVVVAIYVLLRVLSSTAEVLSLFLIPSRKISLKVLREGDDLDRVFSPPLVGTVLGLSALAFYPVINFLLFDIVLWPLTGQLARLYNSVVIRILLDVASFALTVILIRGIVGTRLVPEIRARSIAYSLAILAIFYVAAVKVAVDSGASLTQSLLSPDLGRVAQLIGAVYRDYSYYILTFIESLFKFLGVSP